MRLCLVLLLFGTPVCKRTPCGMESCNTYHKIPKGLKRGYCTNFCTRQCCKCDKACNRGI
jgi:hypothetical protein